MAAIGKHICLNVRVIEGFFRMIKLAKPHQSRLSCRRNLTAELKASLKNPEQLTAKDPTATDAVGKQFGTLIVVAVVASRTPEKQSEILKQRTTQKKLEK
jgi:hypothetical protein